MVLLVIQIQSQNLDKCKYMDEYFLNNLSKEKEVNKMEGLSLGKL